MKTVVVHLPQPVVNLSVYSHDDVTRDRPLLADEDPRKVIYLYQKWAPLRSTVSW